MISYGHRSRTKNVWRRGGKGSWTNRTTVEELYTLWRIVGIARYHFRYDSGVGHRDHAEGRNIITGGYPLYGRVSTTRIFFPPIELFFKSVFTRNSIKAIRFVHILYNAPPICHRNSWSRFSGFGTRLWLTTDILYYYYAVNIFDQLHGKTYVRIAADIQIFV